MLDGAAVLVFDRGGRFLRAIGRKGSGPNEYRGPSDVLSLPGDSVLVLDPENARATVISPQFQYVRSISFPSTFGRGAVLRWPDSVLVSGRASGGAERNPLQLVSFKESIARTVESFGARVAAQRVGYSSDAQQHVSVSARVGTIAVDRYAYDITVWTRVARASRYMQRRPAWFPGPSRGGLGPAKAPLPGISGTWIDGSGMLWVTTQVAAPGWASAWNDTPRFGEIKVSSIAMERLYNSVLELLDPVGARVVARLELNGWIIAVLPGGRLVKYSVDVTGEPRVSIIDAKLSR